MEIFAGLSVCLLVLAALVVAIKTFTLWLRTRGLPELLLSMMLVCATVLGYPLAIAITQIPASRMWWIHVAFQVLMSLGFVCLLLFTLMVFRPGTLWARCLVGLALSMLVAATVAYAIEVTGENPRPPAKLVGLNLFESAPIAVAYFWTTFESLGYYRRLRLRLRLGLTQVVVANRVLLWGLMTLSAGTAVVINMSAIVAGSYMSPPIVLTSSVLGLVHASCLFLAFHSPGWYKAWVERRAAIASS
jgi:hypothetical protein